MSDGSGRIIVTSGNGISPPTGPGNNPPGQLAESVIRLCPNTTTGALTPQDFFSPSNAPSLDSSDSDFGSGGPIGVTVRHAATYPDIMMQAGKGQALYLLNRDSLGGRTAPTAARSPRSARIAKPVEPSRVLRRHPDAHHR